MFWQTALPSLPQTWKLSFSSQKRRNSLKLNFLTCSDLVLFWVAVQRTQETLACTKTWNSWNTTLNPNVAHVFLIATQMWWQRSHGSYGYLVFLHWILLAASGHVQSATKFPSTACPLGVLWRSMRMAAFISPSLPNALQPELWRHQFVRLRSMD